MGDNDSSERQAKRLKKWEQKAPSFKEHLLNMRKDDGAFERLKVRFRAWPRQRPWRG